MLQPVPAHIEPKLMGRKTGGEGADAIGEVIHRHQREGIDGEYREHRGRQIDARHDRYGDGHRNVDRQRYETDRSACAQAARHRATLERPELRI